MKCYDFEWFRRSKKHHTGAITLVPSSWHHFSWTTNYWKAVFTDNTGFWVVKTEKDLANRSWLLCLRKQPRFLQSCGCIAGSFFVYFTISGLQILSFYFTGSSILFFNFWWLQIFVFYRFGSSYTFFTFCVGRSS